MSGPADKAVILARGLGSRMRKGAAGAALSSEQAAAADRGVKALIPIGRADTAGVSPVEVGQAVTSRGTDSIASAGSSRPATRPFLDYVLSALADAGWRRVCLVIGPEHDAVREYYAKLSLRRIRVEMAVQEKPLGTADAVSAAEAFAGGESFLCINSDNYYPREALVALRAMNGAGLAAFDRDALLALGNIPGERIARFGLLSVGSDGCLRRIVEKPSPQELSAMPAPLLVSMNCWRFDRTIFPACRAIGRSPRGELELTDAVQYAMDRLGAKFEAYRCAAPVLDLTGREDVESMARRLSGVRVDL